MKIALLSDLHANRQAVEAVWQHAQERGFDQLVMLGDYVDYGADPVWVVDFAQAREAEGAVLVRGNHDDRAGDPPPEAGIEVVEEPWLLGPFACCHHPQTHATHFVLAGHLHPVCQLSGPARDALRLPCFVSEPGQAVLPAFGAFTGGHALPAAPGRCFHAIGGQRVWAVPGF